MQNKIEIEIGNKKLVAFIQDWEDELPKEVYISIVDNNGIFLQDICMVREHYSYNEDDDCFEIDSDRVDCRVWSDVDNEDYTYKFVIDVYKEE